MRQVWVDFNDVDDRGQTTTLARFAEPGVHLDLGLQVVAGDDDGNVCDARVVDMGRDGSVVLALDLGTFHADGSYQRLAI